MKNILLILTGGTIGSFSENGIISAARSGECRVLQMYRKKYGNRINFEIHQPLNILSENLSVRHWEILINYILSLKLDGFDGMIITHGSDTLSYSSAMLGMCLNHLGIPIVITASNYVPDDQRSNALDNFSSAVKIIESFSAGVYTVFKNGNAYKSAVYIPTRINEADRISDCFSSSDGLSAAVANHESIIPLNPNFDITLLSKYRSMKDLKKISFDKTVKIIHPYPSLDYDEIIIGKNTAAVLHVTYHSATASTEGKNNALTLLEKCHSAGIDMYVCSFKRNTDLYETSNMLIEKGAFPLYNINIESAYTKLLLAVNLYPESIKEFMKKNIYFEETEQ